MKFGEELRCITRNHKEENELLKFKNILLDRAKCGYDMVKIEKLDQKFPLLYADGSLWSWLRENDISVTGGADKNGRNASYIFFWQ